MREYDRGDESWKGEHLIREVVRPLYAGNGIVSGTTATPLELCRAPGCRQTLGTNNRSGYCREHRAMGRHK